MKHYKLAFVFTQAPFGAAVSREGLDALLAASAFCDEDEIAICFLNDGVFNLLPQQEPQQILQKDHIAAFKLLELYELNHCFVCEQSLVVRNLRQCETVLNNLKIVPTEHLIQIVNHSDKVLTF